jgi:hypothetical protein
VRYYIASVLFSVLTIVVQAQVYPVSGTATLIPPYSVYLSDYTSGTSERLMFNIILTDVTRPEQRVRLRIRIEGQNAKLETKPEYIGPELLLQGGVPLRLNGTDLIEYFDPSHLNFSGITRREFEKTGALPQGFYTFCLEVLEFNRGNRISNTICAPGWLVLNDPPLVNFPRNNEKLRPTIPQNVIFQWTPRHTGSPNSAFSTEYEIKLVEMWPATRNPNDAILTSPPILETTTRATTYIYGPAETPLELGRKYALRIRAKSIVGVEELNLFKNNGYSEVISFTYGDACEMPVNVQAKAIGPWKVQVSWQGKFNHTGYTLRYRQAGLPHAEWYMSNTFVDQAEITALTPATTYEYQVSGGCGVFESTFTPIAKITTREQGVADYTCGLPPADFNLDPGKPAASLRPGDIIQAGDFEVTLTQVTGSNGTFSGQGVVVVPFLNNARAKAVFENIVVNQKKRMVRGYMNVTGAAVDMVPDKAASMMDDLTESLGKIDAVLDEGQDALNQIDDALTAVDNVIDEIKAYLPDDILQPITDARNEIAAAKEAMKNADTPEAEAAAEARLKAAKQKLKDGVGKAMEYYAEALRDILKIIKESITELAVENKKDRADAEADLLSGEKEVNQDRETHADSASVIFFHTAEVKNAPESRNDFSRFTASAKKFLTSKETLEKTQLVSKFVAYYSDPKNIQDLGENLKQDGLSLLKLVGTRLKGRHDKEDIKKEVKQALKQAIYKLIQT